MSTNVNPGNIQDLSFEPGDIVTAPLDVEVSSDKETITVPAGVYYVGDPCYTAGKDDNAWQKWCNTISENGEILAATYNGFPVIGLHTAFGDGSYNDQHGVTYGVDAGMIGVVPVELIAKMGLTVDERDYGRVVEFEEETELVRHSDGLLEIGHIVIDTDPSYDDDADEEDWNSEE